MLKLFNFSNRPCWYLSHFTRRYKSTIRPDPVTATDSEETSDKSLSRYMRNYFEEHGLAKIASQAPESFIKRRGKVDYCTHVNPELARRIAFSICSRLEGGCVVESDPGFGFISQILVSFVPHLFLCEKSEDFRSKLKDLKLKHKHVQIIDFNVCTLLRMIRSVQEVPITKVTDFYEDIQSEINASDSQKINWIFSSLTTAPIKNLCLIHLCESSFQQLGKMTYFITLPSTSFKSLTQPFSHDIGNREALVTAFFQIVFDFEILMTAIPRKMFIPWPLLKDPDEELYLIRAVPKDNLESIFGSELLARSFIKFLQIGLRKKQRVIPVLEKYINNCGPLFILEHNLTVYTEFLELSPEKILSLFMAFSKLPEFSHSAFIDDAPDEYPDDAEASEKKLIDEEENCYEDLSESEDEGESDSEYDESNESKKKNLEQS